MYQLPAARRCLTALSRVDCAVGQNARIDVADEESEEPPTPTLLLPASVAIPVPVPVQNGTNGVGGGGGVGNGVALGLALEKLVTAISSAPKLQPPTPSARSRLASGATNAGAGSGSAQGAPQGLVPVVVLTPPQRTCRRTREPLSHWCLSDALTLLFGGTTRTLILYSNLVDGSDFAFACGSVVLLSCSRALPSF